ncbi:MAG TPA: hypothetical protein VER33_18560 [Polyangiaceae bacterium]|nr:hypothetical protein [Polyangiaceae bacterium]
MALLPSRSSVRQLAQLDMLLDGIDVRYVRRAEHWQPKKANERAQGIDKTIAL